MQSLVMQSSGSEWNTMDFVDRKRENNRGNIVPCLDLFVIMKTNYDFHNYYYHESNLK